jgi:hypothetical protein
MPLSTFYARQAIFGSLHSARAAAFFFVQHQKAAFRQNGELRSASRRCDLSFGVRFSTGSNKLNIEDTMGSIPPVLIELDYLRKYASRRGP